MLRKPIFITGAARSGTSMTAGVMSICGAYGGMMSGPTPSNKRGMFENAMIRNQLVKQYLKDIDCDPLGQNPLPDLSQLDLNNKMEKDSNWWYNQVTKVMKMHGYKDFDQPWFYKGAKMCLLWPLWQLAFPEARWVIVRRRPEDIINSCLRTGFMKKCKGQSGWKYWVFEHEKRFQEMADEGMDIREVWPEKMIHGNFKEIEYVVKDLGLTWNEKEVREFISPDLWKGGHNGKSD